MPFTFQVTAELDRPATAAVNWTVVPTRAWEEPLTEIEAGTGVVTAAAALLALLAVEQPRPAERTVTPATSA